MYLYHLDDKEFRKLPELHTNSIESIVLFPFHAMAEGIEETFTGLVSGSTDQTMRLSLLEPGLTGKTIPLGAGTYRSHALPLTSVLLYDANNTLTASASWDGTIKLYDFVGDASR